MAERKRVSKSDFGPSLTKQSFKHECDINRIMDKAAITGSITHLAKNAGAYGDFSDFGPEWYQEQSDNLARWNSVFYDLPSEIRSEFHNDPGKYHRFVTDPANKDRLEELLPELAQPGRQYPDVIGGSAAEPPAAPAASSADGQAVRAETPTEPLTSENSPSGEA